MKIGILNKMLEGVSCKVRFADTDILVTGGESCGVLLGKAYSVKWEEARDSGIEFCIDLGQKCFVDRVVVKLGQRTKVTSAVLKNDSDILNKYNKCISETANNDEIELTAGSFASKLSVTLTTDFSGVEVLCMDVYGAVEDGIDIFPVPQKASVTGYVIPAEEFYSFSADSADGRRAGSILAEKFLENTGVRMSEEESGVVRFVTDKSIKRNGYRVKVSDAVGEGTEIAASDLRGFVLGAECFIKMTNGFGVKEGVVEDAPRMEFRGVHLFVPAADQMDFAKRLIKYLVSPMGYNAAIIEVAAGMKFDSHPEINEGFANAVENSKDGTYPPFPHAGIAGGKPVEKAVVKDYVEYIKSFGIDVIPEVQSLGHVQFMTHVYPEIAEIDEEKQKELVDTREEDAPPPKFYPHCFCTSNELSYKLLFDLLDEIIEVFEPKEYVHMGHDEVYDIGVCPKCKGKDPAQLFADDINKLHSYLAARGLKMMIWSDMLQPVTKYKTPAAINMIPKDIVCMDFIWYFHLDKDIEDNLLEKGFNVIFGNLYSSHFPRYESRIVKNGIMGGQISAWVATAEKEFQQEGKIYDYMRTAEMLWDESYSGRFDLVYDKLISDRMPYLRGELKNVKYPSLRSIVRSETLLDNCVTFPPVKDAERKEGFDVNGDYASLIFYHTMQRKLTRLPWTEHDVVGRYVLTYESGETEEIPLTSCGNIGHWNRRHNQPLKHPLYRHNGYICTYETDGEEFKTAEGEDVTVYKYEYILPKGKKLVSVRLEEDPKFDAGIILCKAEGILKEKWHEKL
ncbi:MAG: hypothetical protein E7634_05655 [Ruminococcaceae bacterium]|nr:hypothetical protein [Oscillospiraceae bacterium]